MIISRQIEIRDEFITNKPTHMSHPRNEPWEYYLFATKVTTIRSKFGLRRDLTLDWQRRKKYIHTISAWTKRDADMKLEQLIKRKDVVLLTKEAV